MRQLSTCWLVAWSERGPETVVLVKRKTTIIACNSIHYLSHQSVRRKKGFFVEWNLTQTRNNAEIYKLESCLVQTIFRRPMFFIVTCSVAHQVNNSHQHCQRQANSKISNAITGENLHNFLVTAKMFYTITTSSQTWHQNAEGLRGPPIPFSIMPRRKT